MTIYKTAMAALALIGGLMGGHSALAQQNGLVPVAIPTAVSTDVDPALWVIKDHDTTIYLFGTVHILKPGLSWFDDGVKAAFDQSDELVLEMVEPPAAEAQALFARYAIDRSGKPLSSKLPAEDKAVFVKAMAGLGLPEAVFEPLDPWAVAVTLQVYGLQKTGYNANSGVEATLTAAAKATRKTISGVETMGSQLEIFDALPQDTQIRFLVESAKTIDQIGAGMDELVSTWSKPDPEALARMMNEGLSDPVLFSRLLTLRNAAWTRWIEQRLQKPGTVFMAVGAGHLAGSVSVQQMLTAYGIQSDRVNY
jgi:uncharacterized protein